MNRFEYDENKSNSNQQKHGVYFESIQQLWKDEELIEIPAKSMDEPRSLVIGCMEGKHWSVVITYRNQHIRIISARRSRKKEVALYESQRV